MKTRLKAGKFLQREKIMDKKEKASPSYNACAGPQQHRDHLCQLMEKGLTEEVRRRSDHPAFACGNCGARANHARDLCNPEPI